jgi:hypothetical protein
MVLGHRYDMTRGEIKKHDKEGPMASNIHYD